LLRSRRAPLVTFSFRFLRVPHPTSLAPAKAQEYGTRRTRPQQQSQTARKRSHLASSTPPCRTRPYIQRFIVPSQTGPAPSHWYDNFGPSNSLRQPKIHIDHQSPSAPSSLEPPHQSMNSDGEFYFRCNSDAVAL